MKSTLCSLSFLLVFLSSCSTQMLSPQQKLDAPKPVNNSTVWTGYMITGADGKLLDSLNTDGFFTPASIQKLYFLPFWSQLKRDTLFLSTGFSFDKNDSSLLIWAGGDPLLRSTEVDSVLELLIKKVGIIKKVTIKTLDYDTTSFWGKGWMFDDEPWDFQPYLNRVPINENVVKVSWTKTIQGDSVSTFPAGLPVTILNGDKKISRNFRENQIMITRDPNSFPGTTQKRTISIPNPDQLIIRFIQQKIGPAPVTFETCQISDFNVKTDYIIRHEFTRLADEILKHSNNLASEQSLRYLAIQSEQTGNFENFKKSFPDPENKNRLADGSGLSRYNLVRLKSVLPALNLVLQETALMSSLAAYGETGTLDDRISLANPDVRILAKSGSMTGVQNLAGFVFIKNKIAGSFIFMRNNLVENKSERDLAEKEFLDYTVGLLGDPKDAKK
ncbi:MAG: D-alanyl-D-alanine carboxypeptidase [Bacteroidetes bacterium]|nr:D-alanyl-D-alanine carboxypeptidase [Bacteroidota bacterium]